MSLKKLACVNYGSFLHLDHLVPIAYFLKIPLFVDSEENFNFLKKYYPMIDFYYKNILDFSFLAKNFDGIISCNNWEYEDKLSFLEATKKDVKLILSPHGNSDKGHINKVNLLSYMIADLAFIYGNHLKDLLQNVDIFQNIQNHLFIGNYRLKFYQLHKKFYDNIAQDEIFSKLNRKNKNILYAPSWKDLEDSSSLPFFFDKIINNLPKNLNLIIKIHPNIEKKNPLDYYRLFQKDLPRNVLIILDTPYIYPILNSTDIYLGDFSSVGYDFLYFQKPMFFLDPKKRDPSKDKSLYLHNAGIQIPENKWDDIFGFIENNLSLNFKEKQKQIYNYSFKKNVDLNNLKEDILKKLFIP